MENLEDAISAHLDDMFYSPSINLCRSSLKAVTACIILCVVLLMDLLTMGHLSTEHTHTLTPLSLHNYTE